MLDLIAEIKSAIAIPKNSPFTQRKPRRFYPSGFLLYLYFYVSMFLCISIFLC